MKKQMIKIMLSEPRCKTMCLSCFAICSFFLLPTGVAEAGNRFSPPSLNVPLDNFSKRFESSSLNVDFIVAHAFNTARQIEREGDNFRKTALLLRNQENTSGATSNSVIIPAGTKANTIIVINKNDGDSYAIQR